MREKKFLDTVHGYISVPENYCDKLIDTQYFQRLRRIEQTSARSLYPCARHDRFVHSLGVYHLGRKFVLSISRQIEIDDALKHTFQIACLLHDCGHSPFSHTLEYLFGEPSELFKIYVEEVHNKGLDKAIESIDIEKFDTKPHEILSALICIKVYYESIIELGGNPSLVGRMIMGIPYGTIDKSIDDCFISLLHGDVIDTDKLDYICRDKWASGYLADSVDLDRLIDAVVIHKNSDGRYKVAYSKSCLNEIQALIDSKNFQNNVVFNHHQVVYEQKLLRDSVKELVESMWDDGKMPPNNLFNYKAFFEPQTVCDNVQIFLPSDDDIVYLMKIRHNVIPHLNEWLSRSYKYFPLWKSYPEMKAMLGNDIASKILMDKGKIYDDICELIKEKMNCDMFALDATPKVKVIKKAQIEIKFTDDKYCDYCELNLPVAPNVYADQTFKYLFIEINAKPNVSEIVSIIIEYVSKY